MAQATAVVGVALQLDAPSLNEPLLAFLATPAGVCALCAFVAPVAAEGDAVAVARSARAARLLVGDADDAPGATGVAKRLDDALHQLAAARLLDALDAAKPRAFARHAAYALARLFRGKPDAVYEAALDGADDSDDDESDGGAPRAPPRLARLLDVAPEVFVELAGGGVSAEARPEDAPLDPSAAPSPEARWKFCIALARWRCLRSLADRCVAGGADAGRAAADACRLFAECVDAAARDVKCGEVLLRGLPGVEAPLLGLLDAPDAPPRARVAAAAALAAACRAGAAPDRGAPGLALEPTTAAGGIDAARSAFLASAAPTIARRAARALIGCESPLLRVHLASVLAACVAAAPTAALVEIPKGAWRDVADRFLAGGDGDVFLRIAFKLLATALVAGHAPTDRTLVVDCDVGARCAASPDDPFRLALCDVLRLRCASLPRDAPLRRLLSASAPWRAAQKAVKAAARTENARQPRGPPQLAAPRVDGLFGLLDLDASAMVGGFDGGDDVDALLDERVDLGSPYAAARGFGGVGPFVPEARARRRPR
jgi:hypothetical protein